MPPVAYPVQRGAVPPQVGPPREPGRGGAERGLLIALALVLVAAAAGAGTWLVLRGQGSGQSAGPVAVTPLVNSPERHIGSSGVGGASVPTASAPAAPTASAPAGPTVTTEDQALAELAVLRDRSLPRLVTDGRWVAQVASKSVGITDPLQTAANGSHTFYATDILAESRTATSSVPDSAVLVLQGTDFGKRSSAGDGRPYWITVVDEGFTSSDQVDAWCASTYPTLVAEQLANACAARTLVPPHD